MSSELATPETHPTGVSVIPGSSQRSVLMLEDDAALSALLKVFLEAEGYEVSIEPSGVEALKRLMLRDFDVILCDMVMPHLPGDMFYLAVERAKPHLCKRFIFMTGFRSEPTIEQFIARVRGTILFKPFQLCQLQDAMQAVEQRQSQPQGS